MLRFTSPILVAIVVVASLSMFLTKHKSTNLSAAVALVGQNYIIEMQRFDSILKQFPSFDYHDSFTTRVSKRGEMLAQFQKAKWLFAYLHPRLANEGFFRPFQYVKREIPNSLPDPRNFLPDNFLFIGNIGGEPDSVVAKAGPRKLEYRLQLFRLWANSLSKLIEESNYHQDLNSLTAADIFAALRSELMRLSSVDIGNSMRELKAQLSTWSQAVEIFLEKLPASSNELRKSFGDTLKAANKFLADFKLKPAFLNRMEFLTAYLLPMSHYFQDLTRVLEIEPAKKIYAIRPEAANLYEENAFNVEYFAPSEKAYLTEPKAELGKLLFFDPILSDNNQRACASCHKPAMGFTDGNVKSVRFDKGELPRNSPTVINAAFQKNLFWDLRATSLEDQLDSVINNENELHSSFDKVIDRLNSSKEYRKLFHKAFPESKRRGIQREHVKIAIACYERTLTGLNSRFDQYVRGDHTRMTEDEIAGFNIVTGGRGLCITCHIPPLFNGTMPPDFDITDHKSLGVPLKDTMQVMELDPDVGASKTFADSFFKFSFKTATMRNVEVTAPYMHNGVYKTLEQVVEFYSHAGGAKFLTDVPALKSQLPYPTFTIFPVQLQLTDQEKKQVIAFMKSLTDTTANKNIPTRLPELTGKHAALNERKIGGEY